MKQYYIMCNVGAVRYLLNIYDGMSKHGDGSPFWDIQCFNNKKALAARVKQLESEGYARK